MKGTFYSDTGQLISKMRKNPIHMERLAGRIKRNREGREVAGQSKRTGMYQHEEANFFDDDETITVYLDHLSDKYFLRTTSSTTEERRTIARKHKHQHEFFEMHYLYSGTCYCYVGEREHLLKPGSIWILNTELPHGIALTDESTNLVNILVRKSTFVESLLYMIDTESVFYKFFADSIYSAHAKPTYMNFQVAPESFLEYELYKLIEEYLNQRQYSKSMMNHILCCIFVELSRIYEEQIHTQRETKSLSIIDLLAYINQNILTITLPKLSEHFHYSTNYISQFMLRETGYGFRETISRLKLKKSQELLCNTDLPIETIAANLGYNSRDGFEKAFKKTFEITPKKYRNQHKE